MCALAVRDYFSDLLPFSNSPGMHPTHVQDWEPVFLHLEEEEGNFFEGLLVKVFMFTKISKTLILGRVLCSSHLLTCWLIIIPCLCILRYSMFVDS